MISVEQAQQLILNHIQSFGIQTVPFKDAIGQVLAEDIQADRDFPPFNRVAMDGICIRYADFQSGIRSFSIQGIQAAGAPPLILDPESAMEIMTGAVLSTNADTVIRYEDVIIENGTATIQINDVRFGQNVHKQGSDCHIGETVLLKHALISATEVGVLATVGQSQINVLKKPSIVIVSTGDELVDVEQVPLSHQIRKSNVYTLQALVAAYLITADLIHLSDIKSEMKESLTDLLAKYDVILLSGAVSKGKFDYLPEVLQELGVAALFHQVMQRPGKPFLFGKKENKCVFAFPGNPVSTFVCAKRFFEPWLKKSLQQVHVPQFACLGSDITFKPNLTYFLQVKLANNDGKIVATPVPGKGSGDLANLVKADAFMELPSNRSAFKAGEVFEVWPF